MANIVERKYVLIRWIALNNLSLVALVTGIVTRSLTSAIYQTTFAKWALHHQQLTKFSFGKGKKKKVGVLCHQFLVLAVCNYPFLVDIQGPEFNGLWNNGTAKATPNTPLPMAMNQQYAIYRHNTEVISKTYM